MTPLERFCRNLVEQAAEAFQWDHTWFLLVERDMEMVELKVIGSDDTVHGYRWSRPFVDRHVVDDDADEIEIIREGINHIKSRAS